MRPRQKLFTKKRSWLFFTVYLKMYSHANKPFVTKWLCGAGITSQNVAIEFAFNVVFLVADISSVVDMFFTKRNVFKKDKCDKDH